MHCESLGEGLHCRRSLKITKIEYLQVFRGLPVAHLDILGVCGIFLTLRVHGRKRLRTTALDTERER